MFYLLKSLTYVKSKMHEEISSFHFFHNYSNSSQSGITIDDSAGLFSARESQCYLVVFSFSKQVRCCVNFNCFTMSCSVSNSELLCVICKQDSTDANDASYQKKTGQYSQKLFPFFPFFSQLQVPNVGQVVHRSCRKNYVNERAVSLASQPFKSRHSTLSATP